MRIPLAEKSILKPHIMDVVNLIQIEDLKDVILVAIAWEVW